MQYKSIFLPSVLLLAMLLAGCSNSNQSGPQQGAFIGGTQGVVATFEELGVPENDIATIFDTETFPIDITLQNKGEYDLKSGDVTVTLLGPSKEEFEGIPSWELKNKGKIEKISELIPNGGEESLSFASKAKYKAAVKGLTDREWFANIDYNYQTHIIIPAVCFKEDPKDERVCDVEGAKTYFVSGAPITITSVEEETSGKGIMALKLKISNAGAGKVAKKGEDFGLRDTLSFTINDPAWECKSGGKTDEARLIEGQAELVCKLKQPLAAGTPPNTKQIDLTLDYTYRDIIKETLRIKQSSE